MNTVATDLRNAALVIEHAGWTQGSDVDWETGGVCAVGSLNLATRFKLARICEVGHHDAPSLWTQQTTSAYGQAETLRRAKAAEKWLERFTDGGLITEWNDEEGRSAVEVTALMREAADWWDITERQLAATQADHELAGGPQQ